MLPPTSRTCRFALKYDTNLSGNRSSSCTRKRRRACALFVLIFTKKNVVKHAEMRIFCFNGYRDPDNASGLRATIAIHPNDFTILRHGPNPAVARSFGGRKRNFLRVDNGGRDSNEFRGGESRFALCALYAPYDTRIVVIVVVFLFFYSFIFLRRRFDRKRHITAANRAV